MQEHEVWGFLSSFSAVARTCNLKWNLEQNDQALDPTSGIQAVAWQCLLQKSEDGRKQLNL